MAYGDYTIARDAFRNGNHYCQCWTNYGPVPNDCQYDSDGHSPSTIDHYPYDDLEDILEKASLGSGILVTFLQPF